MNPHLDTSLGSLDELKEQAKSAKIVYFHVFDSAPDSLITELLASTRPDEHLLLLDVNADRGFLSNTPITLYITSDRQFISKPLVQLRGLGAWARGVLVGFETRPDQWREFIKKCRAFVFGSEHPVEAESTEGGADKVLP
ncbi:MAG: hypothetical protein U0793_23760 [Gemmataceae bacterium]